MGASADVVVIGAGHNGLVAAAYLAKAGLDVLVVEAASTIGGMTSSAAVIPEAPHHQINLCAADVILMRTSTVVEDLDLVRHGLRLLEIDPGYVYLDPDGSSIAVWRDPKRTIEEIARLSPADAVAYRELLLVTNALLDVGLPMLTTNPVRPAPSALLRAAGGALRNRRQLRDLVAMIMGSARLTIEERFEHPTVRSMLASAAAALGPIDADGSGLGHLFIGALHRVGVSRPLGGMQRLADSLATAVTTHGGRLRTDAPVRDILIGAGGRATGIRLESGEEITARRAVVAACDPKTALLGLLPADALDQRWRTRIEDIPTGGGGLACMKVDVATSGQVQLARHERWRGDDLDLRLPTAFIGTLDQISRAQRQSAAGQLPDDAILLSLVPTALDPSQAPPGEDAVYFYVAPVPLHPGETWATAGEGMAKRVVSQAAAFYDGLESLELGRWVETPATLGQRLRVTDSSIFHVDFTPWRAGPSRPARGLAGYETPIPSLFLTGAGTHPTGGVSGISGQLAARRVLKKTRPGR